LQKIKKTQTFAKNCQLYAQILQEIYKREVFFYIVTGGGFLIIYFISIRRYGTDLSRVLFGSYVEHRMLNIEVKKGGASPFEGGRGMN
jgi:hypothetical protein